MRLIRTWKSPQIFLAIVGLSLSCIAGATSEPLGVIVQTAKPYDAVIAGIEGLGGTVTIQYVNADAIAAQIPADRFADLMRLNGVDTVEKDMIVELSTPNEQSLQAQRADNVGSHTHHCFHRRTRRCHHRSSAPVEAWPH